MHYFQFFIYLINSSMSCVEYITFFVLIILLFVGRARLGQLPVQPYGWPCRSKHSKTGGRAPTPRYCYVHGDAGLHHFASTRLTKGQGKRKVAIQVFLYVSTCMEGRREQRHLKFIPQAPVQSQPTQTAVLVNKCPG